MEILTLKEAAAILGTTPDNLRQSIARGSLEGPQDGPGLVRGRQGSRAIPAREPEGTGMIRRLLSRLRCELSSHDNTTDAFGTYCVRCGYGR